MDNRRRGRTARKRHLSGDVNTDFDWLLMLQNTTANEGFRQAFGMLQNGDRRTFRDHQGIAIFDKSLSTR